VEAIVVEFLSGALFFGFMAVALFFLRFWRKTGDRLFALFALSFALMAINRFLLVFMRLSEEVYPYVYLLRFLANVLIIYGIIDKNRNVVPEKRAELS
jgi:hypothetical protein